MVTAQQLTGLPYTCIAVDDYDDLRISGRRYAEQLQESGVDVEFEVRPGTSYGHLNCVGLAEAHTLMERMAGIPRDL